MKICEIFKSLQGEGRNQGKSCIFVRLAGCNLDCAWCDTRYARTGGIEMSVDAVLDHIWRLHGSLICITGGEPLLQGDELLQLLERLHATGAIIEIETNGTIAFSRFQPYATICMDVKCPSSGERSDLSLLGSIRENDCVKFVVQHPVDLGYAEEVIRSYPIRGDIIISPVEGSDVTAIAEWVVSSNLPVRFQVQLHKIIGVK